MNKDQRDRMLRVIHNLRWKIIEFGKKAGLLAAHQHIEGSKEELQKADSVITKIDAAERQLEALCNGGLKDLIEDEHTVEASLHAKIIAFVSENFHNKESLERALVKIHLALQKLEADWNQESEYLNKVA